MKNSTQTTKVPIDSYYLMKVKWKGGFTHDILCRGYNLKSWVDFQKSIEYVESFSYEEITKAAYEKRYHVSIDETVKNTRKKK